MFKLPRIIFRFVSFYPAKREELHHTPALDPVAEHLLSAIQVTQAIDEHGDTSAVLPAVRSALVMIQELTAALRKLELSAALLEPPQPRPLQASAPKRKASRHTRLVPERIHSPARAVAVRLLTRGIAPNEVAKRLLLSGEELSLILKEMAPEESTARIAGSDRPAIQISRTTELIGS